MNDSKKMTIAHVTWSLTSGGIENMLVDIANEQSQYDEVHIFVVNDRVDGSLLKRLNPNIRLHFIKRKEHSRLPFFVIKLNCEICVCKPDIIHFHLDNLSQLIKYKCTKVRTVHNTHSNISELKSFDKVFAISNGVLKYLNKGGYQGAKTIYNGIRFDNLVPRNNVTFRERQILNFICLGRLHPDKGQKILIEAINILVNIRSCKSFSVDIVGDGPDMNELQNLVMKYNLCNYINFLGNIERDKLYHNLHNYDLLILPSTSEGFGLSMAEACGAKIPVLTSNLEGPMEVIDNGRLGLSFESGNASDLAEKIEHFINFGYPSKVIEEAFDFARNNFDVKLTALRYLNEYHHARYGC